ncbi:MAG: DUF1003 domain-containing protein [Candidatus ainarchaeum sp.]|nr:DUF1003 domain-containing protein [Candidatus ainarchaeum sp.]
MEHSFDRQPIIKHIKLTTRQKIADFITKWAGSWTFIILFFVFLISWMIINTIVIFYGAWDPYPFILLNLILSCVAAIQAPIILMSQNRMSEMDRQRAQYDYLVNRKAEREIKRLQIDVLEMKGAILKKLTTTETNRLKEEIKKIQEEVEMIQKKQNQ